jgi:hypothetical protein
MKKRRFILSKIKLKQVSFWFRKAGRVQSQAELRTTPELTHDDADEELPNMKLQT